MNLFQPGPAAGCAGGKCCCYDLHPGSVYVSFEAGISIVLSDLGEKALLNARLLLILKRHFRCLLH